MHALDFCRRGKSLRLLFFYVPPVSEFSIMFSSKEKGAILRRYNFLDVFYIPHYYFMLNKTEITFYHCY